jgi:hypothetical protein
MGMSDDDAARALFGDSTPSAAPSTFAEKLAHFKANKGDAPPPVRSNAEYGEILYSNPGGAPAELSAIDSSLERNGFGNVALQARLDGDVGLDKEVTEIRHGLATAMHELGFSNTAAREFAVLAGQYFDKPRDAEACEKNLDAALETLQREWKGDFKEKLDGAAAVMKILQNKVPGITGFLSHSGLRNDVDFLRILGGVAHHRKVTGKR